MECRVCDSDDLELAIDLGQQPWANHFLKWEQIGKEPYYPLRVMYCHACGTVQLDYTVKKEIMFSDHTYLSGVTQSLNAHFKSIAYEVDLNLVTESRVRSVLDIGSNDGTQLKHFQALGYDVLGVESSRSTAQIAIEAGISTINAFFNLDTARSIGRQFDIINAAGVFFHLEELHSVTDGIREVLRDNGIFVVQFLYMKRIVENNAFDQIYHEHLLYYNLQTLERLLNRHGLALYDAYLAPIHGGSMIAFAAHVGVREQSVRLKALLKAEIDEHSNEFTTYLAFSKRIELMKEENLAYLETCRLEGKRVWGMGAPVKGNTLINYFGIGTQHIQYLVEKNELRRGLYAPGSHIPVVIERELTEFPDIYYVLAWNFKEEILRNNLSLRSKGVEFYFPVNPKDI